MTSDELHKTFKEEVGDDAVPPLWSSPLVYTYMDEAQKKFCRLTDGIADSSSYVSRLSLVPNEAWVHLDSAVLRVRSVRGLRGESFDVIPVERLEEEGIRLNDMRGRTRVLVSGMEECKLRAWPIPTDASDLDASVFRLPIFDIVGPGQQLEIRAEHQYALTYWMKHLAYGKKDSETYDPRDSEKFDAQFRAYCADVKKEQAKLRRTPKPIAYGGY